MKYSDIHVLRIKVQRDDEAGMWCASSNDISGLAVEAETIEALIKVLEEVIPMLWELNHAASPKAAHVAPQEIAPIELVIKGRQRLELAL